MYRIIETGIKKDPRSRLNCTMMIIFLHAYLQIDI